MLVNGAFSSYCTCDPIAANIVLHIASSPTVNIYGFWFVFAKRLELPI